ncbi:MAG: hypothetical protein AB7S93_06335 [Xanthobacteraceae bacterium]
MIAQQKACVGQGRPQPFDRDRQQQIVAEIAAAIVSRKQDAGSALQRHRARPRTGWRRDRADARQS